MKQKICVIGSGLTGLVTAITLSKYNLSIDLVTRDFYKKNCSIRSIALSNENFLFLNKLNILNPNSKIIWPIKQMKLYEINQNFEEKEVLKFAKDYENVNILYMIYYKNLLEKMKKIIKNNKNINITSNYKPKKFFNLIINCTRSNFLYNKKTNVYKNIESDYEAESVTFNIKHHSLDNKTARQFFYSEGPLALLPISKNQTSIVWSIKKIFLSKKLKVKNKFIKKRIKNLLNDFLKIRSISKMEYYDLNFSLARKYYHERTLNFGDALHQIHPFAGQGFNMILRDLVVLEKIIKNKIKYGLDVGEANVLDEFTKGRKAQNFIFAHGINILNKFFSLHNDMFKKFRNFSLQQINKNTATKKIFLKFANKGLNF